MSERIYAGLVVDHKLAGELLRYPAGAAPSDADDDDFLVELPTESLSQGDLRTDRSGSQGTRRSS